MDSKSDFQLLLGARLESALVLKQKSKAQLSRITGILVQQRYIF